MDLLQKIWDFIENWYLESKNPTIIEIIFVVATSVISFLTAIITFVDLFTIKVNIVYKIIPIVLYILLITIVTSLIRKLRLFRYQILERNKFIEIMVNEYDPEYIIQHIKDIHEIKKNGDDFFQRNVTLEYVGKKIPWYEMYLGNTHINSNNHETKIRTVSGEDHRLNLANLPFKKSGSRIYHAILINPILTAEEPESSIIINKDWKRIWKDLIETCNDDGSIRLDFFTRELELILILPNHYEFTSYGITPRIGVWLPIIIDQQHRQCLILKATDLHPNTFKFEIEVRKLK